MAEIDGQTELKHGGFSMANWQCHNQMVYIYIFTHTYLPICTIQPDDLLQSSVGVYGVPVVTKRPHRWSQPGLGVCLGIYPRKFSCWLFCCWEVFHRLPRFQHSRHVEPGSEKDPKIPKLAGTARTNWHNAGRWRKMTHPRADLWITTILSDESLVFAFFWY